MWHSRPLPLRIAGMIGMAVLVAGLFGVVVQQLWNALMPFLFHLPVVGFCQAVGLAILARLLFGHFGGRHHCGPRGFGKHCGSWGKFRCGKEEQDQDLPGGPRSWKKYGAYWSQEGKAHFEAWMERQPDRI